MRIRETKQKYTSKKTSINSAKLPAVFKLVNFECGTTNVDIGGGRFDNATDYLSALNVENSIYDPYNRSELHNNEVIARGINIGGYDTATISNVLNVIEEKDARLTVLNNASEFVKCGGKVFITVYEGDRSGNGKATKCGYQMNRKTDEYLDEVREVFPLASRVGKLIIAYNGK